MTQTLNQVTWPQACDLSPMEVIPHVGAGFFQCNALAVCDGKGSGKKEFQAGERAHFFSEFKMLKEHLVPLGRLVIRDTNGTVVQERHVLPDESIHFDRLQAGTLVRFYQEVDLQVAPGEYFILFRAASVGKGKFVDYQEGRISTENLYSGSQEQCWAAYAELITVGPAISVNGEIPSAPEKGKVMWPSLTAPAVLNRNRKDGPRAPAQEDRPAIFHITHWKAGSQWIHKILLDCVSEHIISPELESAHFLQRPIGSSRIYPTVYVTREKFESVELPRNWRRFVVIRDLRDTMISAYFSMKVSHPEVGQVPEWRKMLNAVDQEQGLIWIMENWLPGCAHVQQSWADAKEPLIHYEDLLENDLEILKRVLLEECRLPVSEQAFEAAVVANRFDKLTHGRPRGKEDIKAHERKGIAGDWRNYFDEKVKEAFKARYGKLLIRTGYETDFNW